MGLAGFIDRFPRSWPGRLWPFANWRWVRSGAIRVRDMKSNHGARPDLLQRYAISEGLWRHGGRSTRRPRDTPRRYASSSLRSTRRALAATRLTGSFPCAFSAGVAQPDSTPCPPWTLAPLPAAHPATAAAKTRNGHKSDAAYRLHPTLALNGKRRKRPSPFARRPFWRGGG